LLTSLPANLPLHLYRKVNERERELVSNTSLAIVLNRRPNRWQTPSQFRRMMTAHVKLRGNAYAMIVRSMFGDKGPTELIPLHPDRVRVVQMPDMSLVYHYTRPDGRSEVFQQSQVMHLMGLTLNGYTGVTPITYLRETIGASLAMERQGSNLFRNGAQVGSVFKMPQGSNLDDAQYKRLKASLDEFKSHGERAGGTLLLEDGMDLGAIGMTLVDAQWIDSRKMSRADIAMAYGVPPHMIGDTEKTTSFGTGIESQNQGYLTYTAEDDLTMWEQAVDRDLIADPRSDLYARFNRSALVKGDLKTRTAAYASALQWGYLSPNEVRELEDRNPRDGGDVFYDPPNTAGGKDAATEKDPTDDAPPAA
jgi:HK97 family phage portal protein